jgi:hypothetical protein
LWASVWIYAPSIGAADREFQTAFDGNYIVESRSGESMIDGRSVADGDTITLTRGSHQHDGSAVRLRLQAPEFRADPAMKEPRLMFDRAYDY